MVRPQTIRLHPEVPGTASATVVDRQFYGYYQVMMLRLETGAPRCARLWACSTRWSLATRSAWGSTAPPPPSAPMAPAVLPLKQANAGAQLLLRSSISGAKGAPPRSPTACSWQRQFAQAAVFPAPWAPPRAPRTLCIILRMPKADEEPFRRCWLLAPVSAGQAFTLVVPPAHPIALSYGVAIAPRQCRRRRGRAMGGPVAVATAFRDNVPNHAAGGLKPPLSPLTG